MLIGLCHTKYKFIKNRVCYWFGARKVR